jgi:N-acyl homoserine lactone hydrolase
MFLYYFTFIHLMKVRGCSLSEQYYRGRVNMEQHKVSTNQMRVNQVQTNEGNSFGWLQPILLSLLFSLAGCSPTPDRVPFIFDVSPKEQTWETIQNRSLKVKYKTLFTGRVKVPTSGMLDLSDSKTEHFTDDSMTVDVYAHWIRHPVKGDYLIDTGLDRRFRDTSQGSLKGLIAAWIIEDSYQEDGQDILSQLAENEIDVKGVFLTHVHGDHSSGIPVLPADTTIVLGKDESLHQYPLIMYSDHFDRVSTLQELDFSTALNIEPLGKMIDLFGDGSVWAIATPGHTSGHVSYLVHSLEGWVLLTGDASHTRWGFENGVIPGWSENDTLALKSLRKLRQFIDENPAIRVVFGHER